MWIQLCPGRALFAVVVKWPGGAVRFVFRLARIDSLAGFWIRPENLRV